MTVQHKCERCSKPSKRALCYSCRRLKEKKQTRKYLHDRDAGIHLPWPH